MIGQAFRFSLIGFCITLVHLVAARALVATGVSVTTANRLAFGCAVCAGFLGHSWFSFAGHSVPKRQAFAKYGLVAITGYLINETILALLLSADVIAPVIALTVAIVSAAAISFVFSRTWAFRSSSQKDR